jgi:hypothetical protein
MLKVEEYLDLVFCYVGFWVVLVFDFYLDFGLGEGEGLVGDGLEILGLSAEVKEG